MLRMVLCKIVLLFLAVIGLSILPVHAIADNLTLDATLNGIQQTDNNPCIIGGSCGQNGGLAFTQISGGDPALVSYVSPTYQVSDLTPFVGNFFFVMIDQNQQGQNGGTPPGTFQTLFTMSVNGTVIFQYTGGGQCVYLENGNGESDCGLRLFSLQGLNPTDLIVFNATIDGNNDGFETWFLNRATCVGEQCFPTVPEPSTMILFGIGLLLVVTVLRKRIPQN